MKKLLTALFVALLMAGCGGGEDSTDLDDPTTLDKRIAEAIDRKKLEWRGEFPELVAYAEDQQTPYTGWVKTMHDNGQIAMLGQRKDGKQDGPGTCWYPNGQKTWERTYKDDKIVTAVGWKPNGEKSDTKVVNGNGVVVSYNNDGTEYRRWTFKDGEAVQD